MSRAAQWAALCESMRFVDAGDELARIWLDDDTKQPVVQLAKVDKLEAATALKLAAWLEENLGPAQ